MGNILDDFQRNNFFERKLNFLITQTEIFAHFMANKVGSASQDETEILGQLDEKQPLPLTTLVDDYDSTVIKEQVKENESKLWEEKDGIRRLW